MPTLKHVLFISALGLCLFPVISPTIALLLGFTFAIFGVSFPWLQKQSSRLLQLAIILLGFSIPLNSAINLAQRGVHETALSILFILLCALFLRPIFKLEKGLALLITCGTAICGGSAIVAVAAVKNIEKNTISLALAIVFTLNALALLIFPTVGHLLHLPQKVFGNWAALAIHDTSSVVAAAASYGSEALKIATVMKLTRALWIVPLILSIALLHNSYKKMYFPWFILLFVGAMLLRFLFNSYLPLFTILSGIGKQLMVMVLFLIGSGLSISSFKELGAKSFYFGMILWCLAAVFTLLYLLSQT